MAMTALYSSLGTLCTSHVLRAFANLHLGSQLCMLALGRNTWGTGGERRLASSNWWALAPTYKFNHWYQAAVLLYKHVGAACSTKLQFAYSIN
eukprot:1147577-Pelagomonas_calceolata.AAC.1